MSLHYVDKFKTVSNCDTITALAVLCISAWYRLLRRYRTSHPQVFKTLVRDGGRHTHPLLRFNYSNTGPQKS
jgi:hypothetical protein